MDSRSFGSLINGFTLPIAFILMMLLAPDKAAAAAPAVCGDAVVQGSEKCDDGGFCANGTSAGSACTSESDCAGTLGACVGGARNLQGCDTGNASACPDGACTKCRPAGGDGCAQNCTLESDIPFPFVPGMADPEPSGSGFITYGLTTLGFPFMGTFELTVGKSRDGGAIPIVMKPNAASTPTQRFQDLTLCWCLRPAAVQTCGGTLYDENDMPSANCTPGFAGAQVCPAGLPCTFIHGPNNLGSGYVDCGADAVEYDVVATQDCTVVNDPLVPPVLAVSDNGAQVGPLKGSGLLFSSSALSAIVGSCQGVGPQYGPDGEFCTFDDDPATFGVPGTLPFTTGSATASLDMSPVTGTTSGGRFACPGGALTSTVGAHLVGATAGCNQGVDFGNTITFSALVSGAAAVVAEAAPVASTVGIGALVVGLLALAGWHLGRRNGNDNHGTS